ncbi:hypothetical protein [Roseibium sp.]|uniref:hypothetical protein n=1 Tax=Roseibium sp. TaxID=1936156 RepID=UPI003D0DB4A1
MKSGIGDAHPLDYRHVPGNLVLITRQGARALAPSPVVPLDQSISRVRYTDIGGSHLVANAQ